MLQRFAQVAVRGGAVSSRCFLVHIARSSQRRVGGWVGLGLVSYLGPFVCMMVEPNAQVTAAVEKSQRMASAD